MDIETLRDTYFHCRANKRRSRDNSYFEIHWERDLVRLCEDVNTRDLVPLLYSFIRRYPCPREVNACQMPTKILQDFFDIRVRPLVEAKLTDRTFNNRVGFGPEVAVNGLLADIYEMSEGFTKDCWIIGRDIQAYFPSALLSRAYDNHRQLIEEALPEGEEREDLLYILMRTVYAYPQNNAHLASPREMWQLIAPGKSVVFNDDPLHGAALGNQFWQVSQNYDINEFDHRQVRNGMRYRRFVDDKRWVVRNKEAGLAYVNAEEKWMEETYGYKSHPRKRSCQHYSKGGYFLGYYFKFDRIYISNRVVRRARWKIQHWNQVASPRRLNQFLGSVNSYLGRCKNVNGYAVLRNLVDMISPEWFRFCEYDDSRKCLRARPGFTHNELLCQKYHFTYKRKNHGHSRQNQPARIRPAGHQSSHS